jgi:hypothetical protein
MYGGLNIVNILADILVDIKSLVNGVKVQADAEAELPVFKCRKRIAVPIPWKYLRN